MSTSTARSRLSRARHRLGRRLLTIEVSVELPDALHEARLLPEWSTEDWGEVAHVVEKMIDELIVQRS